MARLKHCKGGSRPKKANFFTWKIPPHGKESNLPDYFLKAFSKSALVEDWSGIIRNDQDWSRLARTSQDWSGMIMTGQE